MAPVKRATATAQRETRSTRSAAVGKKKATTTVKTTSSPIQKKPTAIRKRGRKQLEEPTTEDELAAEEHIPDAVSESTTATSTRGRPARRTDTESTATKQPSVTVKNLAAAPRRRIKVTPLDTPVEEPAAEKQIKATRGRPKESTSTKSTTKKLRAPIEEAPTEVADELTNGAIEVEVPKARSSRRTASKTTEADVPSTAVPKTRGRPKKQVSEGQSLPVNDNPAPAPTTRTIRTRRVASPVTQHAGVQDDILSVQGSKAAGATRKRVTFQGVTDQDDKENQPLLTSKSNKAAKSSTKTTPDVTGLRAKPLRKPAASATGPKGRKASTATRKAKKGSAEPEGQQETGLPRALTPKKITQVAKTIPEEEHLSDGEDELNGGKTPVRDFGISPRKPPTSAMGQAISPAKRFALGQNSRTQSTTTRLLDGEIKDGMLASPARRPAASPFKDALKGSPKRADGVKLLFPPSSQLQSDVHASIALNPSNIGSASQSMSTLLQSPKRNGTLDAELFSQSAMKHSTTKSPLKRSLLATPAKRLFSPSKKAGTPAMAKISELVMDLDSGEHNKDEDCGREREAGDLESDITVTSHFRASTSPMRVHRVKSNNDGIDFDQSVLEVGSPLKVRRSPTKKALKRKSEVIEPSMSPVDAVTSILQSRVDTVPHPTGTENEVVNPIVLDRVKDNEPDTEIEQILQAENQMSLLGATSDDVDMSKVQPELHLPTIQPTFNVGGLRDTDDTSEDELANDETPIRTMTKQRPSLTGRDSRPRQSAGVPQSAAGKGFGFTPLAAQMSDWLSGNIEKTPKPRPGPVQRNGSFEFSPLARQHVDGGGGISRGSTPIHKPNLKTEIVGLSTASTTQHRKSSGLRKSMAQRHSLGSPLNRVPQTEESPARHTQFEEYMEMRAMEEESEAYREESSSSLNQASLDFDEIMNTTGQDEGSERDADETILVDDFEQEGERLSEQPGDLTTDLVAFTHASDTAMVDFHMLTEEADQLAPPQVENIPNIASTVENVDQTEESLNSSESIHGDENTLPPVDFHLHTEDVQATGGDAEEETFDSKDLEEVQSPVLLPVISSLDSPSMLIIDRSSSPSNAAQNDNNGASRFVPVLLSETTPAKNTSNFSKPGVFNTVVSKVPLKPEGQISPIKMQRKRARSFGTSDTSPKKRLSFGSLKQLAVPGGQRVTQSPDRRTRTSVAPSPGGTSTPASRHNRASFGSMSTVTTPGQTTFMADDFGDSTLDGIEVPDDYDEDTELYYPEGQATPTVPEQDHANESAFETPQAICAATPTASHTITRQTTTPATTKRTPATTGNKAAARNSLNIKPERTPLKPVGKGVLNGVVVYVDVHTSEGADASSIFIELLTQMGARCVKDWRWNSRASLAPHEDGGLAESRTGVTHVVYKDGGKRTLEKVREAKGEVWCVGVAWVLDCERENKWIDEADYAVDTTIMPRGGSKRRKSMEPRALMLGGDGCLSASKARRSVSAEMNELMKRELLNTPARGQQSALQPDEEADDMEDDEVVEQATPTGFVSYDPRTAMTPGTPYLISQGKKLVQMSAPPKQTGKRLFEDEDENDNNQENEEIDHVAKGNDAVVKDAKKFRMKNLDLKARRRTLGFKPVVGSPLAKI